MARRLKIDLVCHIRKGDTGGVGAPGEPAAGAGLLIWGLFLGPAGFCGG